jgi:hypothetical protein
MPRNYAAFERSDAGDAKRGEPTSDLSDYASDRGWEFRGPDLASHFSGLNPRWVDYVFNSMRGELAPGRFGTLAHELYETPVMPDGTFTDISGDFWAKVVRIKKGLGSLIGMPKTPPNEPFAAWSVWLPSTAVKLQVPEAVLLPPTVVRNKSRLGRGNPSLGDVAPNYRMRDDGRVPDDQRQSLAAAIGPPLQGLDFPLVEVELSFGAVALRVNGFRDDPAVLDHLVGVAREIGERCAEAARRWWAPAPFEQSVGPPVPDAHPPWYPSFHRQFTAALTALRTVASEMGLQEEDPVALHRALPILPIPGASQGVLAGTLPGTSTFGRLTWQYQAHGPVGFMRGGVVVAAAPTAPATPPGGVLLAGPDMYVASRDGVACCWARGYTVARLDSVALVERAITAFRESGAAEI